ncbi:hypothetical protein M413DRAFT_31911 [Hebeloma cylindrosporum]|uniref:Uncharacterized protein n=1 Tax=Hebeloma cylindrosporum TaxID=76867 RepID=A0A0C2Y541_HEBCY|nr:hypothetical protein M413DRAFT_31911 [Hebeloma cylindrosporum h7]
MNWLLENGTPPGRPQTPPLRIPTAQSPMPAFFFLGGQETPPPSTPEPRPPPWTSTSWCPMPSFDALGSRDAPSNDSSRSYSIDNRFLAQSLVQSSGIRQDPGSNQHQIGTSPNVHDDAWANPHIWPTGTSLKAPKIFTPTGINMQTEEIPRLWKIQNPQRYATQPVQSTTARRSFPRDWASVGSLPPTGKVSFQVRFGGERPISVCDWITFSCRIELLIAQHHWSLAIAWSPLSPGDDPGGRIGGERFKSLFDLLARQIEQDPTPLAAFQRISIKVPERLEDADVVPITGSERTPEEKEIIDANRVDLGSASNLKQFLFQGSYLFFAEKLSNIPGGRLTLLCITRCKISVNDTLALLSACSSLEDVTIETVCAEVDCELGDRYVLKPDAEFRSNLEELSMTSSVDISGIVSSLAWGDSPTITINILDDVVAGQDWGPCFANVPVNSQIIMNGNFHRKTKAEIQRVIPGVVFGNST